MVLVVVVADFLCLLLGVFHNTDILGGRSREAGGEESLSLHSRGAFHARRAGDARDKQVEVATSAESVIGVSLPRVASTGPMCQ